MKTVLSAALIAALATGCAHRPPGPTTAPAAVTDNKFATAISVTGKKIEDGDYYGNPAYTYFILSTVDKKTGAVTRGIVFNNVYGGSGWKFWNYASTDEPKNLRVTIIDRTTGSCSRYMGCYHSESISMAIDDDTLQSGLRNGINVSISAKHTKPIVISFSASYVQEFYSLEMDALRRTQR